MKLRTFRIGGVHPEENKLTDDAVTQVAALPKQAVFPLSQHIGAPAKPVVKKGDKVKVGTMIAEAGDLFQPLCILLFQVRYLRSTPFLTQQDIASPPL